MNNKVMQSRTKKFALRVIRLVTSLPAGRVGDVFGRQLLKSGTSVGANYREALRASSRRHFITTTEIAAREADETLYWMELLVESGTVRASRLRRSPQRVQRAGCNPDRHLPHRKTQIQNPNLQPQNLPGY